MSFHAHPLLVYGNGKLAEQVLAVLAEDARFSVVAVTADAPYVADDTFQGVPQMPLEDAVARFPAGTVSMLVAVGYKRMRDRARMFARARDLGYTLANVVAGRARVFGDLVMGDNNIIFDHVYLGPGGRLGSGNVIRPQTYVGHDVEIGDHTFIAPGVTIGGGCSIGSLTFVGIGATVLPDTRIADDNLIAAGSLILKDTEPGWLYMGHPAAKVRQHAGDGVEIGAGEPHPNHVGPPAPGGARETRTSEA